MQIICLEFDFVQVNEKLNPEGWQVVYRGFVGNCVVDGGIHFEIVSPEACF